MEAEMIRESKTNVLSHNGERLHQSMRKEAERLLGDKQDEMSLYKRMEKEAKKFLMDSDRTDEESIQLDPVQCLLGAEYREEFQDILKSLAIIDKSLIIKTGEHDQPPSKITLLKRAWSNPQPDLPSQKDQPLHGLSPAILTVRYDARRYRNESEAWAGLALEITREMERRMSGAQRLAAIWNYAWKYNKGKLFLQLIFPFLLVVFLAPWIIWGAWVLMSRSKNNELQKFRYGCIPIGVVLIWWIVMHKVIGTLNSVSDQIDKYFGNSVSDQTDRTHHHADKLGYQENVINDIKFMMEMTASSDKLRVIVFVDDLDRCRPQIVLEILSAINLVLSECKINVIVGTSMHMIRKAVNSRYALAGYEGKDLEVESDKYLQKIFQLPLDLPDPSKHHFKKFLNRQLGAQSKENDMQPSLSTTECNVSSSNQPQQANDPSQHSETDQSPGHHRDLEEGKTPSEADQMTSSKETKKQVIKLNPRITVERLILEYTKSEEKIFSDLGELVTMRDTNPREWKRLLLYHKLVWSILSQSGEKWDDCVGVRTRSLRDVVLKRIFSLLHSESPRTDGTGTGETITFEIAEKCGQELNDLRSALEKKIDFSVEKDAIIAFQAFRFNCKPKFLSFPTSDSSNPSNTKEKK
eukprot:Gb_38074 [translate_table: standard]